MSRVPEKWRKLAHAEIDGADIQYKSKIDHEWHTTENPTWPEEYEFRIDPKCDYALAKIPEKHREVYLQWCDGAEVEYKFKNRPEWYTASQCDPLGWHDWCIYRVKPKTVKRWQWLVICDRKTCHITDWMTDDEIGDWSCCPSRVSKIEETMREDEV